MVGATGPDGRMLLDLRGLRCPLPALRTQKRLEAMAAGGVLTVLADDPLAAVDMAHLCGERGHRLLSAEAVDTHRVFRIECGGVPKGRATGASDRLP